MKQRETSHFPSTGALMALRLLQGDRFLMSSEVVFFFLKRHLFLKRETQGKKSKVETETGGTELDM